MNDLVCRIKEEIIQQAEDIFEYFGMVPSFSIVEVPNPCGGNSELHVTFKYTGRYEGREEKFIYRPATQTQNGFLNEIKAYLLDCVDTFVNI